MLPRRVGILGFGRFGRAFADLCLERGTSVRALDTAAPVPDALRAETHAELVDGADVVVVAVPVAEMSRALEVLVPSLPPSVLVLDVGSVKTRPIEALDAALGDRFAWLGTHPLFGPTSLALGERPLRVVMCPNPRRPDAWDRARAFYEGLGCEVIEQDADAHDRTMAETHALTFFVAKGMLDVGAGEGAPFAPPSFQAIARTIEAVRSDAGHLFLAIERDNPHAGPARRRLLDALANVDEQLRSDQLPPSSEAPPPRLSIPGLGTESPDLRETRELIDELDFELMRLLARRATLSRRAARAKAELGQGIRDPERERTLLAARARWAEEHELDPDAVRDVFDAILRFSRALQRK